MSLLAGAIAIKLDADTLGLSKGLGQAQKDIQGIAKNMFDLEGVTKSLNTSFEATAGILKTGFLVGLTGVTTAMGLFTKNTADMEQTRAGFEGMIGDVAKTDALLKQLVETAKKTPLQFTDVAKNAENLLAFGVASDTINDKVKMLGDIARGNSVKLGLLTNVYGQVKSAGKLMGQDLLQFTSQGIPLIDGLSKHFGVAKEEIKKMVEDGKVGFNDVDSVLQDLTGTGGLFYKSMEKQSLTLNGIVSNLTDTFFGFGRALMGMDTTGKIEEGGIFWYLAQGGQKLLDIVGQLDGKAIGQSIIDFAEQVQSFVTPIIDYFREHTDQLNAVLVGLGGGVIGAVVISLGILVGSVIAITWPFVLLGVVVGGLFYLFQINQPLFYAIATAIGVVGIAILIAMLPAIISATVAFGSMAIAVALATWPIIAIALAIGGLVYAGVYLYQNWSTIWPQIVSVAGRAWDGIKSFFSGVGQWFGDKFNDAKNRIVEAFNSLSGINLSQIGKDIVQGLINGLNDKLNDLKNKARDLANTVQNGIKDALKIKSPSRVMMELGQYTGEGFAMGMDKTENLVKSSGQNMAQSSVGGVSAGQSQISSITNNNTTPITINISGYNQDPRSLADIVIREINKQTQMSSLGLNSKYA